MSGIQVTKLHTFLGHKDSVYTLEPFNGQPQFFSGSGDGMVVRWDFNQPDKGHLIANMQNSVYALRCIPEKGMLIVGHNFQGIHLIDLEANKQSGSLSITKSAIFDIKHAGSNLMVATGEGIVYVVDPIKLKVIRPIGHATKSARSMAVNHQADELAVGYSDHTIRIFDLSSFQLKQELHGHTNSVFTVVYHPHQPLLLSAGRDAHLKAWDLENNYGLKESIAAHLYAINHIEFSPNGLHFVTCSMDKSIKVWDAQTFKLLKVIDKARYAGHGTSVNKLYWSPFNQQLVSCSDDRTITIWDLKT